MATPPASTSDAASESQEQPYDPPSIGPTGPVRILVQTRTQFVPSKDKEYWMRIRLMENLICQHVWNRDYDWGRERARHRGCEFAYDNRDCWFLVDYPFTSAEPATGPPVLRYKWAGTSVIQLNEPLPSRVLKELQRYPFTKVPGTFLPPGKLEPRVRRKFLKNKLMCNMDFTLDDINYVREYPEHARWVKARLDEKAWRRLAEIVESVEWQEKREAGNTDNVGLALEHSNK